MKIKNRFLRNKGRIKSFIYKDKLRDKGRIKSFIYKKKNNKGE